MTYRELRARLAPLYGESEARAVSDLLLGDAFGLSKADILCGAVERLGESDASRLERMAERLEAFEPVQYVVGSAEFCGRRFRVCPDVLIPRPETEELCAWVTADCRDVDSPAVLDVGTGSGCIACTLALDLPGSVVSAWDISPSALAVAAGNAAFLGAHVAFAVQDALYKESDNALWDVIVSNPPYIYNKERARMERNVLDYEPHSALFVPDEDPLLFYRAIAAYALTALKPAGRLFFEINPLCAGSLYAMFTEMGFRNIEIRKDGWGRERMIRLSMKSRELRNTP